MSPEAIFAGIGAVITAAAGMALVIREFRNREHRAARAEINQLVADLYRIDDAYIAQRRYAFTLRQMLADVGAEVPPQPPIEIIEVEHERPSPRSRADVRSKRDPNVHDGSGDG